MWPKQQTATSGTTERRNTEKVRWGRNGGVTCIFSPCLNVSRDGKEVMPESILFLIRAPWTGMTRHWTVESLRAGTSRLLHSIIGYWHHYVACLSICVCLSVMLCVIVLRIGVQGWKLYHHILSRQLPIHFFGHFCCGIYYLATKGTVKMNQRQFLTSGRHLFIRPSDRMMTTTFPL